MKSIWIITFLWLLGSCTQPSRHTDKQKENTPDTGHPPIPKEGIVHKHIQSLADTTFSYALFLPENYTNIMEMANKAFPIIFFFDAHKRGALPVEKYAGLAEFYGFVLAGSNNSTNGQQVEEMKRAVSMMINNVSERFRIDKKRIATCGFSGGARVAADVALYQNKEISAVIGCAAGFPQIRANYNTGFSYLGMVGDKDFNYLEMRNIDQALEQTPIPHYLVVYDGKHDWPPADIMRQGFEFLLFDAMKRNPAFHDAYLIRDFLNRNDSIRKIAYKEKNLEKIVSADEKILAFLQHLVPVEQYKTELDSLYQLDVYKEMQEAQKKSIAFERSQQQRYASAMPAESLKWWINEINGLYEKPGDLVNQRLLNYLSLVSFMYASDALRQNQLKESEKYLTIYKKVDPENPEVYYLKAVLSARSDQPKQLFIELQKAADHGFNEYERMKNSPDFKIYQENPDFRRILSEVKNKNGN